MSKALLLGIDLQEGFLTDEIRQTDFVTRVETFLASQPTESIVLSRFVNKPGSSFELYLDWKAMQRGDSDTKLFGSLENNGYDVIEKTSYTAWLSYVQTRAEAIGATDIVMFGLDSDVCVLKTALDVFEAGYRPVVLSDLCHSSNGKPQHESGIEQLRLLIGESQIMTSDMMPPRA